MTTVIEAKKEDFKDIIDLFEEDAGTSSIHANIDMQRLFLKGETDDYDENELMLRLNTYKSKLVVARIQFIHQRNGFGKRLLELLIEYGVKHNYKVLEFESVLTEPMQKFLSKHGFQLASNQPYELNWIKEI